MYESELMIGDARDLSFLEDNSVDLICSHPPYANIIQYTDHKEGDLSFLDIHEFLEQMSRVAKESFRVLKPGRQCAILIGDMRRKKHVIPLGFKLIDIFLNAGFKLRELVIKRQHNCKTTGFWYANSIKYNFLLLAHEYLPIFEKPQHSEIQKIREELGEYMTITPKLDRLSLKSKLRELETTTVWIFPPEEFEQRLNKNVVERYWRGDGYLIITLTSTTNNVEPLVQQRKKKRNSLLFIRLPVLNNNFSSSFNMERYLKEIPRIIDGEQPNLNKGGAVVIFCKDIRENGYIIPVAKRIIDTIKYDELRLKEIVIVTQNGTAQEQNKDSNNDYLTITHQYLLVYEKLN